MGKRIIVFTISLFALLTLLVACQTDDEKSKESSVEDTAELFLKNLSEEKYEEAYDQLDEEMVDAIEIGDLEELWTMIEQTSGEHIEFEYERTDEETEEAYELVYIKSIFSKEDITFMVTVTEDQEIAGFFVV